MALRLHLGRQSPVPETRVQALRVYLRPPVERDWQEWSLVRERSRTHLTPWEPSWPVDALTREFFRRRLKRYADSWKTDHGYAFLMFRQADDALLGGLTLTNVRRGVVQAATIGYWIGGMHAGQGYMTEGVKALQGFVFDRLALHRLEAACLPHNHASRKVLDKAGFREEGLARKFLCIAGAWQDHLLFAVVEDEWRAGQWASRSGAGNPAGAQAAGTVRPHPVLGGKPGAAVDRRA